MTRKCTLNSSFFGWANCWVHFLSNFFNAKSGPMDPKKCSGGTFCIGTLQGGSIFCTNKFGGPALGPLFARSTFSYVQFYSVYTQLQAHENYYAVEEF